MSRHDSSSLPDTPAIYIIFSNISECSAMGGNSIPSCGEQFRS